MTARLVTLGETLGLVRSESPGSLAQQHRMALSIGGAESNVAVGVVRLGGQATWLGRVGDDAIGARVVRELRAEGVEVRAIVDGDAPTGLMLKEVAVPGTSRVVYYRSGSAGSRLAPSDVASAVIQNAGMLHVTGITLALSTSARDAVFAAVDLADEHRVRISFDVNHRASLWRSDEYIELYRELARRADVVFAGEAEAEILTGRPSHAEGAAAAIAELGPAEAIVKLGGRGCSAVVDGQEQRLDAVPVTPVDTVGAGDAFVAGYLAERLAGLPAAAALSTAVRAGAFACLNAGDWEGAARRADLDLLTAADPVQR